MTQLEYAKDNIVTPCIKRIAQNEGLKPKHLLRLIKEGKAVIPLNKTRRIKSPCGIGLGLRTKVNANIGTSTDKSRIKDELLKLSVAIRYGADTVMDLSMGGDIRNTRLQILKKSSVPIGTVPIYEIAIQAAQKKKDFLDFGINEVLEVLESQGRDGVDFFTIHAGVTRKSLSVLKKHRRMLDIVSRGGAILANWMARHKRENPFFEYFDKVLDIAYRYDICLSLGDGLRPGSVLDATDKPQICELKILGELARRCTKRNIQVMIEGPGHVPLHQIQENVLLQKRLCNNAPFYVLGPLVTDVASGWDHISSSIGAAIAAGAGADFLCYVTPSEHLRHPTVEDVKEGMVAFKIAAHAADIAKGIRGALDWDKEMSIARKKRDWRKQIRLSIDPDKARRYRMSSKPALRDACTMCGKYCSIRLMEDCMRAPDGSF
ncbi:MAG: phosphomethylpyrimidine synthase ThiC [Candidatus Omnitrophota bacterium]